MIYNQIEAYQNQASNKGEQDNKDKKDNVEECVIFEGQILGKRAYQRRASLVSLFTLRKLQ